MKPSFQINKLKPQKGSRLDQYIGYALILYAKKTR